MSAGWLCCVMSMPLLCRWAPSILMASVLRASTSAILVHMAPGGGEPCTGNAPQETAEQLE